MGKVDETRARTATVVFNSRADAKYLATLLAFWYDQGEKPRSVSELVRVSLETFADLMIQNGLVDMVASQTIAYDMFERAGIMNQKMRELNRKNLVKAMAGEDLNLGALKGIDTLGSHRLNPAPVSSTPGFSEALANLETNMNNGIEDRVQDAKDRTEGFKESLGLDPKESEDE